MPQRIVVDENIPLARSVFGLLGEVILAPGRAISPETVRDATALVVRSVTRVDAALLAGSAVRFVGSATIGTDHVDADFLAGAGIAFAYAPGSNARSVAEYVAAALLELEPLLDRDWSGRSLGVVGVGNVGRLVVEQGRALGMTVLACDPPRAEAEGSAGFVDLDVVLRQADAITLHTPLVRGGAHPTAGLVGARELERVRRGAVLINTSRGGVVDGGALRSALERSALAAAVLDVWPHEPDVDLDLAQQVAIATPHVAGYSLDGKLAGTRAIAAALARFLGVAPPPAAVFDTSVGETRIAPASPGREAVREAVRAAYPIREDDRRLRAVLAGPAAERATGFDRLRRDYPPRREFRRHRLDAASLGGRERTVLAGLGFAPH